MSKYYVKISNAYVSTGLGSTFSPFTFTQFVDRLSSTTVSDEYYVSGTRIINTDLLMTISGATCVISAWGEDPYYIVGNSADIYFAIGSNSLNIYDMILGCTLSTTTEVLFDSTEDEARSQNLVIDNCYINLTTYNIGFEDFNSVIVRNSNLVADKIIGQNIVSMSFVNDIFDVSDIDCTEDNDVDVFTLDNCAFTSATAGFTTDDTDWTNVQELWARPDDIFNASVSAISADSFHYLSADFGTITISGDTDYTNTWYNGRRDGIGSLYFPALSGVSVSASLVSAAPNTTISFVLSGNNPFTVFSATSATYYFDDENTSAVNTNSTLAHIYSATDYYNTSAVMISKNSWYTVTTPVQVILVGAFTVIIKVYDAFGNDKTGGVLRPLSYVSVSASANGYDGIDSYVWDFGDATGSVPVSGITNPDNTYYIGLGMKTISLTAHAVEETFSATANTTLGISALTSAYYVNITSAYDANTGNIGTLADPYNWDEFKTRVESFVSADYSDTYYLSGSRKLTQPTTGQNVLAINSLKNLTIDCWENSATHGAPWLLEIEDWTTTNANSILSAVGTTLKNGIIYNKRYISPGYGGTLKITNVYDMFIVYQGTYAGIEIDPWNFVLYCGGTCGVVMPSADSNIIGSTLYLSGNGFTDNFVVGDYSEIYLPATQQTGYNLDLIDSVFVNLDLEDSNYFSAADVYIRNSTFNRASSAIEADFDISANDDSQFGWSPPVSYPFTPSHRLYDKNIEYVILKKGDLVPFSDIDMPPNPGYGASAYSEYDTGLWGYARNQYNTSAS
jgi:hypothetical protein